MGKIVKKDQACLVCSSSDARQIYEDGGSKCYSCERYFPAKKEAERVSSSPSTLRVKKISPAEIATYATRGFEARAIIKVVCEKYGVKVSYNADGNIDHHYYPYENSEKYKIRKLPKEFSWTPSGSDQLFGQELFSGGGKRLIICEGECDTLAVATASYLKYNKFYPVIGISSSAMADKLIKHRTWIRSFKEVVICFDEDEAGHKAQKIAAKIVGYDKARLAKLPKNDANDVLVELGGKELMICIFDSTT